VPANFVCIAQTRKMSFNVTTCLQPAFYPNAYGDIYHYNFWSNKSHSVCCIYSYQYWKYVAIVTNPKPMTHFDNLIMPFDALGWALIFLIFVVSTLIGTVMLICDMPFHKVSTLLHMLNCYGVHPLCTGLH